MKKLAIFLIIVFIVLFVANNINPKTASPINHKTSSETSPETSPEIEIIEGYAISTASEEGTLAAEAVLESGGNAVDAAIAAAYVIGVTEPYGSGLGGSGGMLIYDNGEYVFLDYYAEASSGSVVGIPGFVSGMEKAHELYGTMDMEDLISYAIGYARNGIEAGSELAYRASMEEGELVIQEELADTLEYIAKGGDFYTGEIAEKISEASGISTDDLAAYETRVTSPIVSDLGEYTIAAAPAPFSGLAVVQMLKLLQNADPKEFIDLFVKVKMAVNSERYSVICDQADIDYDALLTEEHLATLMEKHETGANEKSGTETVHISVVADGMAVSMTNTLTDFWGSGIYVDGFFLNDTMTNFGSGVNAYAPGKRPRTFISPVIVQKDGYILAAGSPGGNAIPDVMTTVLADILFYGEDPQKAVEKPRIIVKDYDTLMVEGDMDISGYYLIHNNSSRKFGSVNIAGYDGEYFAVSDPHRNGVARQCP